MIRKTCILIGLACLIHCSDEPTDTSQSDADQGDADRFDADTSRDSSPDTEQVESDSDVLDDASDADVDGDTESEQEICGFLPVLPGARGYGVEGPIARGTSIFRVTNTDSTGDGSLTSAVDAAEDAGGGIIVFETSGVIDIESDDSMRSRLNVGASNIWIAGQTAPEPGIAIRGGLIFGGSDFLVQHIGVYRPQQLERTHLPPDERARQTDTISLYGTNGGADPGRAILDHVAAWGANDGNIDIAYYGGGSVTIQNSIVGPPLIGGHDEGEGHNFNSLIYGSTGTARLTYRFNLFTTARDRQPLSSFDELILVNNVYYNRELQSGRYIYLRNAYENENDSQNSIVGNYFWDTASEFWALPVLLRGDLLATTRVFLEDNWWNLADPHIPEDPWDVMVSPNDNPRDPIFATERPVWNTCLEALPSTDVLEYVRANVGPRPAERLAFYSILTDEMGADPTHEFPRSLDDIDGELLGLAENTRAFTTPDSPHEVQPNGYTRIENLLIEMSRELSL